MISPLAIATRGRLSNGIRRTLTLVTVGWIVGVGAIQKDNSDVLGRKTNYTQHQEKNWRLEREKRIRLDDEEVFAFIKCFEKLQT